MKISHHPLLILLLLLPGSLFAQNLQSVTQSNDKINQAAQRSQEKIDKLSQQTQKLLSQYKEVAKQLDGVRAYNGLLEKQVNHQRGEIQDLEAAIKQVTVVERQIAPLMLRMIEALESFIELDTPFLLQERQQRVTGLKLLMERADVTVAEKFRLVMEAYQTENEYGRTIESYKDTLDIDGQAREVEVLRIGRMGLYYQTLSADRVGVWDTEQGQWQPLPNEQRSAIRQGLRMARKQVAPDLLILPVAAPE